MRNDIAIEIEELILIESAQYPKQFLRPYRAEMNGGIIDRVGERLQRTKKFTPSILANMANQFIVPDTRPRGLIEIPHGWHERRGRFVLTLSLKMPTGDRLRQVVMGYTNTVGFSHRRVDPDMEFYINNTYMLNSRIVGERGRSRQVWMPNANNEVYSDRSDSGGRRSSNRDRRFTVRPEDIYSTLDAAETMQVVDDVTDMRTTLGRNSVKSRSGNRINGRYMASVLTARQKAINASDEWGTGAMDITATAQGYVAESFPTEDVFMRRISNNRGCDATIDDFMFRDLTDMDPSIERRVNPKRFDDETRAATRYDEEDINPCDGQEEEDRIAALVAMAVPALMLECGIFAMTLQAHNQTISGDFEIVPNDVRSLLGKDVDMGIFIDMLIDRLRDELFVPISADGRMDVGIELRCRIFGEVDFTLFWAGEGRGRWVFPCFCNSLSSPVITDDRNDVKDLAESFNTLFDEVLPIGMNGGRSGDYNF